MDDRDELPLCRQPNKSSWQQFNEFWSQTFFGEFLMGILTSYSSSLTKYCFIAATVYCFPSLWSWLNRRRIIRDRAAYEENQLILYEILEEFKRVRTKQDHLDATMAATSIHSHPQSSGSTNIIEAISTQPCNSDQRGRCNSINNGVEEKDTENKGEIKEIEGEVRMNIPDKSPNLSKVVGIAENSRILGTSSVSIKGSRILENKVKVRDDILDELFRLADACTAIDNRVTVQLGDCRIFIRTEKGVEQLKLDTVRDELPVILHSSYALGTLTIEGMNLENATLKVATFKKSITLNNVAYKQVQRELGVCTWFGLLPSENCDKVYVCATRTIRIQEHEAVLVTSSVVKIQDNSLRSVVRFGIPSIIFMIYMTNQLYEDGSKLEKLCLEWIVPLSLVIIIQLLPRLPPSKENKINESVERVYIIFLVLQSSIWNFRFK